MKYDPLGNICRRDNNGTLSGYTYAQLGGCGLNGLPGGTTAGSASSGYQLLQAGSEHFVTEPTAA